MPISLRFLKALVKLNGRIRRPELHLPTFLPQREVRMSVPAAEAYRVLKIDDVARLIWRWGGRSSNWRWETERSGLREIYRCGRSGKWW